MNNLKFTALLTALMLVGSVVAEAQSTNQPDRKTKPKTSASKSLKPATKSAPSFSPTFWLGSDVSPLKYLTNNPNSVLKWLEEKQAEQETLLPRKPDSFSTSEERADYEAAININRPSLPPLPLLIACEKSYDADNQVFEITVVADHRMSGLVDKTELQRFGMDLKSLKVRSIATLTSDIYKTGSYAAQNAFGATFEVDKVNIRRVVLLIPFGEDVDPITSFVSKYPGNNDLKQLGAYKLRVPMPPAEAREANNDIQCLGVISLSWPAITYREKTISPHRANGYTLKHEVEYGMLGKLDQIMVFNKSSGDVYQKISRAGVTP